MAVPAVNLSLDKGTDFEATFTITVSDGSTITLYNHTATAKIRKHPAAETSRSFQTTITAAKGEIKISMGSTTTALLTPGRNYYDVTIKETATNKITKVFEGMVLVNNTVSV